MPRHPPCALQHFNNTQTQTTKPDTKRCSHPLCNTQHTTTPRTHHNHHHTHQTPKCPHRDALDGPGREQPPEKTTTNRQMSPQDPTACRTRFHQLWRYVPPSHTPPTRKGCGNNKKETHNTMPQVRPPIRGSSLERR